MKIYFLSFGVKVYEDYESALKRIVEQANSMQVFDKIIAVTDRDLYNDEEFRTKHWNFCLGNLRGFGYWIWKPYIVKKILNVMDEGDILLYCDAGCELNPNGRERFMEYIDMVNEHNSLAVNVVFIEKTWTKEDLFIKLNAHQFKDTRQIQSGVVFLKKNEQTIKFANDWYNIMSSDSYSNITDSPSINKNDDTFKEHRHDQSVLSLLFKLNGMFSIPDETYYPNNWIEGFKFPILTSRTKSYNSAMPWNKN